MMLNLIKFTLLVIAFVIATGCQSQSSGIRDKASSPPWRESVKIDEMSARQSSISTQLQSLLPKGGIIYTFDVLRHDDQTGLEYYIYTDGGFDGQFIAYAVDSINNIVTSRGYYRVQSGWNELKMNPFKLDISGESKGEI